MAATSPDGIHPLAPGAPMFYCGGNDVPWHPIVPPGTKALTPGELAAEAAQRFAIARREGLTAFEPYVKWWLCEPEPGRWDFSYYDALAQAARAAGIRLVPFIIAGPAYGTPPWFKASGESLFARCLEHDQETKTQSIWNPKLRPHVEEFLRRFAGHFAPDGIECVLLGVSGDFGESIYTAGGNVWTYLDDPYHVHAGYWCGDREARAHFRAAMKRRYGTIARLNAAWGTKHAAFEDVAPFLPGAAPQQPAGNSIQFRAAPRRRTPRYRGDPELDVSQSRLLHRRARLDFQRWYCAAMTEWSDVWLAAARRTFPRSRIQLCTGGSGDSLLGADFSAQAEVCARHGAGIRITNEATDYVGNYMLTRHVATSCRHYGTYFGFEPAGGVESHGIAGRVYNATASGADELFTYDPFPEGERAERYAASRRFLVKREPLVDVGLFLNRTAWDLGMLHGFGEAGSALRPVTDFDLVDERLIAAGALKRLRVLVWAAGPVAEAETIRRIAAWVRGGGILMVSGIEGIETVEGSRASERALLPERAFRTTALERYRIDVGTPAGDRMLRGQWQGPEGQPGFTAGDATFRWSTAGSEVELPMPEGGAVTVAVCVRAGGPNPEAQVLRAAGREVARVPGTGVHTLTFRLSGEQVASRQPVRLAFEGPTWRPGSQDTRELGVAVVWVAVAKGDVPAEELARAPALGAVPGMTLERLAREYTRRLGRGACVFVPAGDVTLPAAARAAIYSPQLFVPGARAPYSPPEGDTDGVFTTRFRDGSALLLNFTDREAAVRWGGKAVTLAPRSIGEVK